MSESDELRDEALVRGTFGYQIEAIRHAARCEELVLQLLAAAGPAEGVLRAARALRRSQDGSVTYAAALEHEAQAAALGLTIEPNDPGR